VIVPLMTCSLICVTVIGVQVTAHRHLPFRNLPGWLKVMRAALAHVKAVRFVVQWVLPPLWQR